MPTVSLVSSTRSAEIHPPGNPQTCVSNGIRTNLKVTPRSAKSSAKWKLLKRSRERQVTDCCLEKYCRKLCSCSISLAEGRRVKELNLETRQGIHRLFQGQCLHVWCLLHQQRTREGEEQPCHAFCHAASLIFTTKKPNRSQTFQVGWLNKFICP